MVEKILLEQLQRIFDMKVTMNRPSAEAPEQDVLFVELSTVRGAATQGREYYRVEGRAFVFVQNEKMPVGHFRRKIQEADLADQQPFTFINVDSFDGFYQNISQRSFEFVYLYAGQYNPPAGTITEVEFQEEGEEE